MIVVSLNLKKCKFGQLINEGIIEINDSGLIYYGVNHMFSLSLPIVKLSVKDSKFVKVLEELGHKIKHDYDGLTLDEFFERLAVQGFGVFEYSLIDDKLIISGQSNFCKVCFDHYKKPVKVNVDALLTSLFSEVGNKIFKKCNLKKKTCMALGDDNCSYEITRS